MGQKLTKQEEALRMIRDSKKPANCSTATRTLLKAWIKNYGAEALRVTRRKPQFIRSSSMRLNQILGGGWRRGRVFEVFGPESGGKTTLGLDCIANAQRQYPDEQVLVIEPEATLDLNRAASLGVDVMKMPPPILPPTGDAALDMVFEACLSGAFSVILFDSVAGIVPSEELLLDATESKNQVSLVARLMSNMLRKIVLAASHTDTAVLFINQVREKPGEMYGNPETTPGGRALKFYASARILVKPKSGKAEEVKYKDADGNLMGHVVEMVVVKNKMGAPFRKAETNLFYTKPLDVMSEIEDLGIKYGVIQKVGRSPYSFGGAEIAKTIDEFRNTVRLDDNLRHSIMDAIEAEVSKPVDNDLQQMKQRESEKLVAEVPDAVDQVSQVDKLLDGEESPVPQPSGDGAL